MTDYFKGLLTGSAIFAAIGMTTCAGRDIARSKPNLETCEASLKNCNDDLARVILLTDEYEETVDRLKERCR